MPDYKEYLVVANGEVLSGHLYDRDATQNANEAVLTYHQEVYVYKLYRKHWRVATDDSPKEVK